MLSPPDPRGSGRRSLRLVVALLSVFALLAVLAVAAVLVRGAFTRVKDNLAPGHLAASDLAVGDCVLQPASSGPELRGRVISCEKPHKSEVVAVFTLKGSWRGVERVESKVATRCQKRAGRYVGASELFFLDERALAPADKESFKRDPTVACLVSSATYLDHSVKQTS
jgi:hypothetical protein